MPKVTYQGADAVQMPNQRAAIVAIPIPKFLTCLPMEHDCLSEGMFA